jgi:hypothetical protein
LVWSTPMVTIIKKFNTTDVEIKKICKRLNIPLPKSGHWQKLQYGKKVDQPPLPNRFKEENITLPLKDANLNIIGKISPIKILQTEIEDHLQSKLVVPIKLTNPDKLITKLQEEIKERDIKRFEDLKYSVRDTIDSKVSYKHLQRSLCIWNTLIKALRLRGHDIEVTYSDTYAIIEEHRFKILLRERTKREVYKDRNYDRSRYIPTGILYFQVYRFSPQKEWKDGKVLLEFQLSNIIAYLEIEGEKEKLERIESQKRHEIQKEKERVIKEFEQQKEKDLEDFKTTLLESERWHKSNNLRNYINEVEVRAISNNSYTEKLKEWIEWARNKADWYDPFIAKEDVLLSNIDRITLTIKKEKDIWSWS